MNFTLVRTSSGLYGIMGRLVSYDGTMDLFTLEHAFSEGGAFVAKLATGIYTCKKGIHKLDHGGPITAFEVVDVPPFQGKPVSRILLHVGNYNKDSDGCVLLGAQMGTGCILESEKAFTAFMEKLADVDEFILTVT